MDLKALLDLLEAHGVELKIEQEGREGGWTATYTDKSGEREYLSAQTPHRALERLAVFVTSQTGD